MPRIITRKRIDKEFLTTKLTLIIIGLTAGSGLLIPATYASFHPVTTGEIADDTIRSADISNTAGVASVDIINGQVGSVDIRDGQVSSVDIANDAIKPNIQIVNGNMTVAPGGSNSIMLFCPTGTLITGGGFGKENEQINILASISVSSDRWFVSASNSGVGDTLVNARALCIGPMP
jgi:hypothetical protein